MGMRTVVRQDSGKGDVSHGVVIVEDDTAMRIGLKMPIDWERAGLVRY